MTYVKQTWADGAAGGTPITADALNHIEDGIAAAAAGGDLADVALSGDYADLANKPTLSTVAATGAYADLSGKPTLSTVAATGAYADLTGKPTFSTVATTGAYADLSGKPTIPAAYTDEQARDAVGTALVAGTGITIVVDDINDTITLTSAAAPTLANLPAGTTLTVLKTAGTWPARPTARADIIVAWKGADPSPAIVSSGTGGMLDTVDYRLVTP